MNGDKSSSCDFQFFVRHDEVNQLRTTTNLPVVFIFCVKNDVYCGSRVLNICIILRLKASLQLYGQNM